MSGEPADEIAPAPDGKDADDSSLRHIGAAAWRALKQANMQRKVAIEPSTKEPPR